MVTLCWCCESPNSLCSLFVLEVAQVFVALSVPADLSASALMNENFI